jgi:hypothetical protein
MRALWLKAYRPSTYLSTDRDFGLFRLRLRLLRLRR